MEKVRRVHPLVSSRVDCKRDHNIKTTTFPVQLGKSEPGFIFTSTKNSLISFSSHPGRLLLTTTQRVTGTVNHVLRVGGAGRTPRAFPLMTKTGRPGDDGAGFATTLYGPSPLKQSLFCVFLSAPTPPSTYFHPLPPFSVFSCL